MGIDEVQDLGEVSSVAFGKLMDAGFDSAGASINSSQNWIEGYAYCCMLCEEILALSRDAVHPLKVRWAFSNTCPGCGGMLDNFLEIKASKIPAWVRVVTNCRGTEGNYLLKDRVGVALKFSTGLDRLLNASLRLTTGIKKLDALLALSFGQLASFHGATSNAFASLLCVRASMSSQGGHGSGVVFIDGGNVFDSYLIAAYAVKHEVDPEWILEGIHLSRAFTHHQLSRLINEKLPSAIDQFNAKLVAVSDVTLLYCDPDVQDRDEAIIAFRRDMRSLSSLAAKKNALIAVTNLKTRDQRMDEALVQTANISARLEYNDNLIQLALLKHPLNPQLETSISINQQTLEDYL